LLSNNKWLALVVSLIFLGSLAGCGFHLRPAVVIPPELNNISIAGAAEYAPLTLEFKRVLTRAGATFAPAGTGALSTITLQGGNFKKRVLSVDALGRAAEYELLLSYSFKIVTKEGRELVPLQKIELTRDYRFDPNNVLAKDTEEAHIRAEMIRFSVSQAMRRINAVLHSKP